MDAGSPAYTGQAGAIHRSVCFAGKPAPAETAAHLRFLQI
ncbi:diguanylate cyclase [Pseudomonas sp. CK-NBRI-02]|uniref:Diguanylate cyclase n=1 Tax=Pseudomonas guariconensis TaxID=1288410 RepID=A0AAX0W0Q7_9PSED|nr:diguanylate cyclase [Pseudomonas guariconensis]PLV25595.1 diguanylate cyclase [Pseudomonas guariconensis]PLV30692.1 diguanylate cyclase [Pseudomonas guariconensis]TYO75437.1 diguanylate cyclase [Pseudomonas sp. CK-NBRI-02]